QPGGVVGELRRGLGLPLVGHAAGLVEQVQPRDLQRQRRRVVGRSRFGERCVRVDLLRLTGEVFLGQLYALYRGRGKQGSCRSRRRGFGCRCDGKARRGGDGGGQRRLGICEFVVRSGEVVVGGLDGGGGGRDGVARFDEVRTQGLHIADGRAAVGEDPPVPVEGLDVALGRAAEILVCRRECILGRSHRSLGIVDAGLRGGYRIFGGRTRRRGCRGRAGGVPIVGTSSRLCEACPVVRR